MHHISPVAPILWADTSLKAELWKITKVGEVLDVKLLLVGGESLLNIDIDVVYIIEVVMC